MLSSLFFILILFAETFEYSKAGYRYMANEKGWYRNVLFYLTNIATGYDKFSPPLSLQSSITDEYLRN